jgi:hypothetical protein
MRGSVPAMPSLSEALRSIGANPSRRLSAVLQFRIKLFWKLIRENFELVDFRCFRKQIAGLAPLRRRIRSGGTVHQISVEDKGWSKINEAR